MQLYCRGHFVIDNRAEWVKCMQISIANGSSYENEWIFIK